MAAAEAALVAELFPTILGILGGGKGGGRQEVKPEQLPAYPEVIEPSMELFGELLEEFLSNPDVLTGTTTPIEEMDFGPTDIGEAGQAALAELRGFKPTYDVFPEEALGTQWITDLLGGKTGTAARAALGDIEKSAYTLGEQMLRGSEARTRAKYAKAGQLYGGAPIAETAQAAKEMGTELATGAAGRRSALEQGLLGLQAQAIPQLTGIAGQRGERGLETARTRLSALREELATGGLQAQLRQEIARRRMLEQQRREETPLTRLQTLAAILQGFRPGESYLPMTEPSSTAQALSSLSKVLPGIWEAVDEYIKARRGQQEAPAEAQ